MTKILAVGEPNSQALKIKSIEENLATRVGANKQGYDGDLRSFANYVLALDTQKGWRRPISERLKRFESELRSAFLNAGFENFVNESAKLGQDWNHGDGYPASGRTNMVTDYVNLKQGLNLSAAHLIIDMSLLSYEELLPELKRTLAHQEINRLISSELGIPENDVVPALRLNPNKGQSDRSTIDMSEDQRHEFLRTVAEKFDIDANQLIESFESQKWASVGELWRSVLEQASSKYDIELQRERELIA